MKKLLAITIALMLAAISVLPVFAENIQSPSVAPMPPVIKVIERILLSFELTDDNQCIYCVSGKP